MFVKATLELGGRRILPVRMGELLGAYEAEHPTLRIRRQVTRSCNNDVLPKLQPAKTQGHRYHPLYQRQLWSQQAAYRRALRQPTLRQRTTHKRQAPPTFANDVKHACKQRANGDLVRVVTSPPTPVFASMSSRFAFLCT